MNSSLIEPKGHRSLLVADSYCISSKPLGEREKKQTKVQKATKLYICQVTVILRNWIHQGGKGKEQMNGTKKAVPTRNDPPACRTKAIQPQPQSIAG